MKIQPNGWVRTFLETQLDGLTGHLEEAGFPFDVVRWGTNPDYQKDNGGNPGWWVYEQTAYWVDGLTRCALLLNNQEYLAKVRKIISDVFDNADEDGYLGPKFLKENKPWNRWPHVVFFRACMALHEYTQEAMILDKLTAHYLNSRVDYSRGRDIYNIEIMLWLYGKTGNKALLEYAVESYAAYNKNAAGALSDRTMTVSQTMREDNCDEQALSDRKPYSHGVTYNEYFKLGAMLYTYTGNKKYLEVSVKAYEKIDKYFMLPSGCHCSNEFLIDDDYMQSVETCDVTDYTWALSYLLGATEDGSYADKIEKCIFNAGIGSVLEDFRGLQYFSCANQIIADATSNHNVFYKGASWMSYRPNPGTECCPGNVNRFMPNFVWNSWRQEEDKIYSLYYVPTTVETEINGKKVAIQQKTNYPFEETAVYHITTETPFVLYVRKPQWAAEFTIRKAGEICAISLEKGYVAVAIENSCQVEVTMSSEIVTHKQKGKVWFSKGALVYSFGMKGNRQIDTNERKSSVDFPAYNIYPNEEWRYCITGTPVYVPVKGAESFDLDKPLPYLEVSAKVITNMDLSHKTKIRWCLSLYEKAYAYKKGNFTFTPRLLSNKQMVVDEKSERVIRLYPYGACKLRMTVFNRQSMGK